MIAGQAYRIGQVGSFVRIPQGYQDLFGIVYEVGATARPTQVVQANDETGRWMKVQLVGEAVGSTFERGISQFPNIGDAVHLAVEEDLWRVYGVRGRGYVPIGSLSSAESIPARIALNELVTRHSAILGSTGSGKSTTVATLLRSIASPPTLEMGYASARILLLDLHGEYTSPLADLAQVFSVDPQAGQERLQIPYWALDTAELLQFLTGGLEGNRETAFTDKIFALKLESQKKKKFDGVDSDSMTVDTPLPFSLRRLWYDLIDFEVRTFEGPNRDLPTKRVDGDPGKMQAPKYQPHAMGSAGPFLNTQAFGIQRPLNLMRSRLLDRRYDFLLHPGPWEPALDGTVSKDLDELLRGWLGGPKPITILDLSGVPSSVLEQLVGSILKIVYESLFWSREKSEGGVERPLLIVMEEAHRYVSDRGGGLALATVQKIAKEGRKYGVGAMVVSQRPSEVNETILSQCGTFLALRLANPADRARVEGALPDGLASLMDVLPVLRTGEAIVIGEAAVLPMRCRMALPKSSHRPKSQDPDVTSAWGLPRRAEGYDRVVASWRAQRPRAVVGDVKIVRKKADGESGEA